MDLTELSQLIQKRKVSPVEVINSLLSDIEGQNPSYNAYVTVTSEIALEQAERAEQEIMSGHWRGPLHGVPIGIKDIIYTKDIRTTMGSKVYKEFVPDYDAAVVEKLKNAGAVLVGKLNTHEFAYGTTGDRSYFGPTRNPHDVSKISGGSSSGAGAAVAAELCYGALGTDTGGSIRIPASCCGVVGMKPTFGRVSKFGVFPLSYSLDCAGPLTRTVRDNAQLLNVLAGKDSRDPFSLNMASEDFTRALDISIQGKIIGIPTSYYYDVLQDEVKTQVMGAIQYFKELGAEVRSIDLPDIHEFVTAHRAIQQSEAYAVHVETIRDNGSQIDPEVRQRIAAGADVKGYEYVLAQQMKMKAREQFESLFNQVDAIVTPTLPIVPPNIDEREIEIEGINKNVRAQLLRMTAPTNLTGHPSLSLPCGVSKEALPIGIQLIGPLFSEAALYQLAFQFEQAQA